ncbi:MAG: heavy metal-responsive transcriptional regulator [Microcoleaceae cyanobacterium MO_207.B10]|nr:heavy metal-responsive transcriptional regulator [Microcoleaceae cyanobacterium MO_207.B10]
MKIGQVATVSGFPIKTIRYYEDIGLLSPSVERSESGYRLFQESVISRLDLIKRAKSLGLSLSVIREILEIRDRGLLPCQEVKEQLENKVREINNQIDALENLKAGLKKILQQWQDKPLHHQVGLTICPNIQNDENEQ